jgi:hypothetical protein
MLGPVFEFRAASLARRCKALACLGSICLSSIIASSQSAAEDAPEDYYFQSISAMNERVQEPHYYIFHYKLEQRHNSDVVTDDLDVVEDTATRNAEETVHADASKHFLVLPDLFGSAVSARSPGAEMLQLGAADGRSDAASVPKTLGTVRVRYTNYVVTIAQADSTSECGPALDLQLRPRPNVDEYKYNLRGITIVKATGMICGATALWKAGSFLGHKFPILFALHVDQTTGLVTRWAASGTARSAFLSYEYSAEGEYTDIVASDEPQSHP